MFKWTVVLAALISSFVLVACGGRSANPVSRYQVGDERRECEGLKVEIAHNETEVLKLLPSEDATGKNVALGVTGAFFIVPLFFMDFKDAEGTEIKAYRERNLWLRELASRQKCDLPPPKIKFQEKKNEEPKSDDEPTS